MSDNLPQGDIVKYAELAVAPCKTLDQLIEFSAKATALRDAAKASQYPKEIWNAYLAAAALARRKAGELLDPETGVERRGPGRYSNSPNVGELGVDDHDPKIRVGSLSTTGG